MALFRKKPKAPLHRIFLASDLHGSTQCFRKLLKAPEIYEADSLVIAGDLTGKMMVPIVAEGDGFVSHLFGERAAISKEEVADHEETIESIGLYAYRTSPEEVEALESDPDAIDRIFHRLVRERLELWLEMAEDRLPEGVECFVVPGNDDYPDIDEVLAQGVHVHNVDGTKVALDEHHEVVGLGVSNPTPWHAPRDVSEEEIASRLAAVLSELEDVSSAVAIIHVPPAGTAIDLAPEIDEDFRPTKGGDNMIHVGSTAVRTWIEESQPLVTLHGHIHESRGFDRVGRTTCVNPGSEYGQGILRGTLVNLAPNEFAGHLFVSG